MFKKLILAVIATSVFVWGFFVHPQITNAEQATPSANVDVNTNKDNWEKFSVILNKVSQWLYAMSWPMMILAGTFTDNDVIYGTFIGLDKSLWWIWNMIRTLANFFIWFLFIVSVLLYFWDIKKEQLNPMKLLPQMVLASVLVNASWFIIWALLDLSTITTYAVWLLPMKVDDTMKDVAIPKVTITFAPTNSSSKFKVELCGKYEPCVFDHNWLETTKKPCYYLGKEGNNGERIVYKVLNTWEKPNGGDPLEGCLIKKEDMLNNMKNLTGPFISIFQSLLDSSQVAKNEASLNPSTNASITIMKWLFLIALLIPLLTLCIILVVRAVLLWMIIVFSPLIFLFTAISGFKGVLWDKKSLSAVISLIFLPVFVTFALSMSLVFMNALQMSRIDYDIKWPKLLSLFGCKSSDENKMICSIKDGTDIEIELAQNDKTTGWLLKDLGKWMGRIIANLFGIWFMWVLVFAALKSSKITEGIASSIERFSTSMAKAAPLIPVAGAGMQSISSLKRWIDNIANIPRQKYGQQYQEKIAPIMKEWQRDITGIEKKLALKARDEAEQLKVVEKDVDTSKLLKQEKETSFIDLTPKQRSNMATTFGKVWISREAISAVANDEKYKSLSFEKGWSTIQKALKEHQNKINLRDYLKKSFLEEDLSLFQAIKMHPEIGDKFDEIYEKCDFDDRKTSHVVDLAKKWIHRAEIRSEIQSLMRNFQEIWIDNKDDIFKLLVDDIRDTQIKKEDRSVLEDIYANAIGSKDTK